MRCPACQTELPDDARFCGACGHRFAPAAPSVGAGPGPAPAVAKKTPTPPASPFALTPEDFARALEKACERAGVEPPPPPLPHDHASLRAAASALGIPVVDMEKALHRIGVEKLPEEKRRAMGVILDDEVQAAPRSPLVPLIIGLNVVAVVVVVLAFVLREPPPMTVELKPQRGEIDTAALGVTVDALTGSAEACFRAAVAKQPGQGGDLVVGVRIGLDGRTESASVLRGTLADEGARACIVDAARAASWPAARGAPVDVEIPLAFAVTTQE